jgi:TonB family protein
MVFALSFSRNAFANSNINRNSELIKEANLEQTIWNALDTIPSHEKGKKVESKSDSKNNPNQDGVYTRVDQMPQFRSGENEMLQYLAKNIKYPAYARENGIQGTVVVTFVIDEKGRVINPIVVSEPLEYLDEEALWIINNMPRWNPGIHEGKRVKVSYILPIRFKM